LLLRHLPAKRSALLLDKVGPDRARMLMSFISRDDAINYETFRDSAGMIFEKYFSMQSASSFTKRDIEKIMNTIEELPIEKQEEYLLMLAENAPSLYETIDRRIIIWDRLMMIDEQILKEAIDDIDSRTLAQALNDTSAFIEDVLLNLRPEREKMMIRELMQEETPTKQETEHARRKIVEAIKEINELQKKT
jgi:flagellar motor switch protein FliG